MTRPLDFFQFENGSLSVEGVAVRDLAERLGTPLYVYSSRGLLHSLNQLQQGLREIDHQICFAVKSNSNLAVLKLLTDAGAGLDVVSGGELFRARKIGVSGEKIVFSGVGKTRDEMIEAMGYDGSGIFSFNVESIPELLSLNETARHQKRIARVALRVNPDVDAKTHPYISTGLKKNKFGIRASDILKAVKTLQNLPNLRLCGISIHIGSQLLSLSPLDDAFAKARALVDRITPLLLHRLEFVDLGGGLGITYRNEKPPSIGAYCKVVLKHFGPKFQRENRVKILLEPGRVISGNAGALITKTLFRKTNGKKSFLIVDAAMNDLIRPALYESFHEIVPVDQRYARGKKIKTDVVGPVCETGDCLGSDRLLSEKIREGELLAILSAGAYGFSMSSNYNSRGRAPEVLVRGGEFQLIRDRESYDDLIRGERI